MQVCAFGSILPNNNVIFSDYVRNFTLTQAAEQMLSTFERKILRKMYGPTQEGGCWRSRWNNELYGLYKEPNIVEGIKFRRLGWAGHITRMEDQRIPKKGLKWKLPYCETSGKTKK